MKTPVTVGRVQSTSHDKPAVLIKSSKKTTYQRWTLVGSTFSTIKTAFLKSDIVYYSQRFIECAHNIGSNKTYSALRGHPFAAPTTRAGSLTD